MSIEKRAERLTRTLAAAMSPYPVEEIVPLWVDEVAEAMRQVRADALEEAARLVEGPVERFTSAFLAGRIRALKADAPAG